jgi:hypothetical protein
MIRLHASHELLLTAAGLAGAVVAKSLRLAAEAGRGYWDTDG